MAELRKAIAKLMESRPEPRPPEAVAEPVADIAGEVLAALHRQVGVEERALVERFAQALLPRLAEEGVTAAPEALAARVTSAFRFVAERGRSALAARIFRPEAARDGWESAHAVIETALDDRPFIVDTLRAFVEAAGGTVRLLVHPILRTERRPDGSLVRVEAAEPGAKDPGTLESFVHLEAEGLAPSAELQQQLVQRLRAILLVTGDYAAMRARLGELVTAVRAGGPARAETAAWLEWLAHKRFVFLGYREYDVRTDGGEPRAAVRAHSGLGLLRDPAPSRWASGAPLPPALARRLDGSRDLLVSKTTARSPVHRPAPMEDIAVVETDAQGTVTGVRRFLGLFTAAAYADVAGEVPLLRQQLAAVLHRAGATDGSHDARELGELFAALPREELLVSTVDDVLDTLRAIRAAETATQVEVLCRPDVLHRALIVVVLLPRARFSTELHAHVTATLRARVPGPILLEELVLDERPVARLHYQIAAAPEVLTAPPRAALREALGAVLRTWDDALGDTLAAIVPAGEAARLAEQYRTAFPPAYKASTDVHMAAHDVRCLEALRSTGEPQIELLAGSDGRPPTLKLYLRDEPLTLSGFVPVLEHLGLRVLGQDVIDVSLADGERASVHSFGVELPAGAPADVDALGPRLAATLRAVRAGQTISDPLHTLVLTAGLAWRAVAVLRAYAAHAHQCGSGETATITAALVANPACAQALFAAFAARFDPEASALPVADRLAGPIAEADAALQAALAAVPTLAHDRILRALAAAVCATVRTNAYATPPAAALAFKLDGTRLAHLPPPQPPLEAWVHGVGVQGVHLRAGPVARGGIRHSDRPDDFRTEVLGLLRTQIVKNAVIVPVGAKGAFIVAPARGGRPEPGQVASAYRDFIEALLSLTDTQEGGAGRPSGLLAYDGPDAYLVVAADKGTAAFSDLANELAAERGYWLGDAFASGGRHGYDHKRLGITARGAWTCAREHFRALGRDLDREAVTVAGIGDMSGDVFGNGMLRSRHLLLLAAFDHRHVFLDPAPDAERAFRERERLFALPRSSWADYSPAALGPGGGVYPRDAKAVPLSPPARALLEIEEPEPTGEAVVRAILRLRVDLLWNGGIGTYVKASDETHEQVDDPANDAVRIDARELRALVVAEGGNLGLTQRARIEYALGGGHINTDAIDNSGGVDCSDHEVNLKIALRPLVAQGALSLDERNALLAELAEPVCAAVLAHNASQARALHRDQLRSRTQLGAFRDLTAILGAEAGLRSDDAHLPSRETLRLRRGVYRGLTRPELAVLLAHTKLDLRRRLLESPLCDAPELEPLLRAYFPAALVERFPRAVLQHPLRREIIAVELANRLIDTMGMTYLVRAVRDGGHDVLQVVRAWLVAWLLIDGGALIDELAAQRDRIAIATEERCLQLLEAGLERAAAVLAELGDTESIGRLLGTVRQPVGTLLAQWPEGLGVTAGEAHRAAVGELVGGGVAEPLADRIVRAGALGEMLEIAALAQGGAGSLSLVGEAYAALGERFALDWLAELVCAALPGDGRWDPRAAASLLDSVRETRRGLVHAVLAGRTSGAPVAEAIEVFLSARREQVEVVGGLIEDLRAAEPSVPAILVLLRELGRLARPAGATKPWQ